MRVIAQTEVPVNPSFMHLAYVSAVQADYNFYVILLVGVISLYFLQRKKWIWKIGVIAVVAVASVIMFKVIPPKYLRPDMITMMWERDIYAAALKLQERGEQVPTDVQEIQQRSGIKFERMQDAWYRDFRVTSYKEGCNTEYRVVSAGKDGKFDTKDDVRCPYYTNTEEVQKAVRDYHENIQDMIRQGLVVPKETETKPSQWDTELRDMDPWNEFYVIRRDKSGVRVISAGPDKKIDTKDDIVYPAQDRN